MESYKLFVFTLSACMAGVAGALYVPQVGIINPSEFAPGNSIEAVIWVAVGGRGTLTGAVLGAVLVNYGKTYFTSGCARALLAVHARRPVHRGDAAAAARHRRHHPALGQRARRAAAALAEDGVSTARRPDPRRAGRSEREMDERTTSSLLYLDGVTVSFDGFRALNNLSLTLEPGEMRAIIGPNGAGKTTMMDVITGKTRPDEGDVLFDGTTDLTRLDETRIAELGIGRKFQKPTVFESHTVEDNLLLALKSGPPRPRHPVLARETPRTRAAASTASSIRSAWRRCATASPAACRTARSSGSRSACCWRRIRNSCWSTSRSPA